MAAHTVWRSGCAQAGGVPGAQRPQHQVRRLPRLHCLRSLAKEIVEGNVQRLLCKLITHSQPDISWTSGGSCLLLQMVQRLHTQAQKSEGLRPGQAAVTSQLWGRRCKPPSWGVKGNDGRWSVATRVGEPLHKAPGHVFRVGSGPRTPAGPGQPGGPREPLASPPTNPRGVFTVRVV